MDSEFTFILMARNMRANGITINSMDSVLKYGLMALSTKDIIVMAANTVLVATNGPMAQFLPATGSRTKYTGSELTSGLMEDPTRVSGDRTTWKVLESTDGKTVVSTLASTSMIKNTDTASTNGKTPASTPDTGRTASNTVSVSTQS